MDIFLQILQGIWDYAGWMLAVVAFLASTIVARSAWMFWREEVYKSSFKLLPWVFLEIKVPREVLKGPKAMEQFFAALNPLGNHPGSFAKKWLDGEVPRWHTIDIIGRDNSVRIFMRVSSKISAAIEGLLYAAYPDIEIFEVEDPLAKEFPATYDELSAQGYDLFGNELQQGSSSVISIRTYSEFEEERGDEKGRIIDPFSVLLELVGGLKPTEILLVQYILIPTSSKMHHIKHFKHEAKHLLEELQNTTQQVGTDKAGKPQYRFRFRTPGEEGVIKRVEDKLEKAIFETTIRYMYIARKEDYNYNVGYRGIQTFFNQFQHDKQSLDRNLHAMTKAEWYYYPWIFPATRLYWRRKAFYNEHMNRFVPEETFAGKLYNSYFWAWCFFHKPMLLSAEEVATLFHIPTNVVLTQSTMERIESKRLAAPTNLPTE